MDVISAYRDVGSYRGAAATARTPRSSPQVFTTALRPLRLSSTNV